MGCVNPSLAPKKLPLKNLLLRIFIERRFKHHLQTKCNCKKHIEDRNSTSVVCKKLHYTGILPAETIGFFRIMSDMDNGTFLENS